MIVGAELRSASIAHDRFVAGVIDFDLPASLPEKVKSALNGAVDRIEIHEAGGVSVDRSRPKTLRDHGWGRDGWLNRESMVAVLDGNALDQLHEFVKLQFCSARSLSIRFTAFVNIGELPADVKREADLGFEDVVYSFVENGGEVSLTDWSFLIHDRDTSEHLR